jgi:hypothetical protein
MAWNYRRAKMLLQHLCQFTLSQLTEIRRDYRQTFRCRGDSHFQKNFSPANGLNPPTPLEGIRRAPATKALKLNSPPLRFGPT